jgi:hypothetical protein
LGRSKSASHLQGFLGSWRRSIKLQSQLSMALIGSLRFCWLYVPVAASLFGCVLALRFIISVAFGCVLALRFVIIGTFGRVVAMLFLSNQAHQSATKRISRPSKSPASLVHCATTRRCTPTPFAAFVPHCATGAGELGVMPQSPSG